MEQRLNRWVAVTVESVRRSTKTGRCVVILAAEGNERHLPIWIGRYEGDAITMQLQGNRPSRPLAYDLFAALAAATGAAVVGTRITGPTDNRDYYTAAVEVRTRDGETVDLDARPSDAILLAAQAGAPIQVARSAMDRLGVVLRDGEPPPEPRSARRGPTA